MTVYDNEGVEWRSTNNLRFVWKRGREVLQQQWEATNVVVIEDPQTKIFEWRDVPLDVQPKDMPNFRGPGR